MAINDDWTAEGEPAFPVAVHDSAKVTYSGMSLRDWFAGQTLSIVFDNYPEWQLRAWFGERSGLTRDEIRAKAAYALADAMLAERAKVAK